MPPSSSLHRRHGVRRSLAAPLRMAVGVIHHDQQEGECNDRDDDDGDKVGCGSCHVGAPFETTVSVSCGSGQIAPVKTLVLYPWEYRGHPAQRPWRRVRAPDHGGAARPQRGRHETGPRPFAQKVGLRSGSACLFAGEAAHQGVRE